MRSKFHHSNIMINHLTGGPPDTPSLTLSVCIGRFHVTLRIHSVAVGSSHGSDPPGAFFVKTRSSLSMSHEGCKHARDVSLFRRAGRAKERSSVGGLSRDVEALKESCKSSRGAMAAAWCPDALVTREELPTEPDSGSEGSSTVEPVQVTGHARRPRSLAQC